LHKIEEGERFILEIKEVEQLVEQVIIIIKEEVKDEQTIKHIGQRLRGVRW
jgi:hypothetical protein